MKKYFAIILIFAALVPQQIFAATVFAGWKGTVVYDGYGKVSATPSLVSLVPKAATLPTETHAALVVSQKSLHQPFQLSYSMRTLKQLRQGTAPNPWEVGWVAFGYKDSGAFKYLILKPQGYGVEFGESLLNNNQNFLYTSVMGKDKFPVGATYNVVIRAKNNVVTATVNGKLYMSYTLSSKDQLDVDGKYAFYTEDAAVKVWNVKAIQY